MSREPPSQRVAQACRMSPVLVALVLLVGNVVKGMAGFGGPLLAIPVLSLGMPTADAMMLAILTDLATSVWLGFDAWRRVSVRLALIILLPLLAGQFVGTELLAVLPVDTVRVILAIVVGAFALSLLIRPVRPEGPPDDSSAQTPRALVLAAIAGLAGGVMSGVVGPAGPPVIAWVRRHMSDASGRLLMLAVFFPTSAWLVALLLAKGLTSPPVFLESLAMTPVAMAGAWAGKRLAGTVSPATFGRTIGLVLAAAAIGLVAR